MIDFAIDCPLFLRLTNARLGEHGLYQVSASGVSASLTEPDVEDTPLEAYFSAEFLEHIENARLPFPTTAQQLLAWKLKNKDTQYLLPTWFERVVTANDAAAARSILNDAIPAIDHSIQKWKTEKSTQAMLNKLRAEAEREAIESIKPILSAAEDKQVVAPSAVDRQRSDLMAIEIEVAIGQGKSTLAAVMTWLRQQAGKSGSCVISADNDGGVTWRNIDGKNMGLSKESLKQRLIRRNRQQGIANGTAT